MIFLLKPPAFSADKRSMSNIEQPVLVIDDDPVFTEFMTKSIEAAGHKAVAVHNGTDGLRWARSLRPAMVICDLSMPGLGGVEVLRMLRDDPATTHIPRVLLSGYACPLRGVAADTFLAKPVTAETVHRLLQSLVGQKQAA
jgi:CheY-like chemotaxis protein